MAGRSASEIPRPSTVRGSSSAIMPEVGRQRSLVEEDPDSERVPARTVCAAFSLLVLGLVRNYEAIRAAPNAIPKDTLDVQIASLLDS